MPPEQPRLLIDVATAAAVRESVGPISWVVLEAIASLAPPGAGVVEVECSARSLAGLVRVSKDTVARSLASMIALGVVERVDHRDELSGRFLSATYRVDMSTVGISVVVPKPAESASTTSAPTRSPRSKPCRSAQPPQLTQPLHEEHPQRTSLAPLEDPSSIPIQRPETNHQAVTDLHPDAGPVPIRDFPNPAPVMCDTAGNGR